MKRRGMLKKLSKKKKKKKKEDESLGKKTRISNKDDKLGYALAIEVRNFIDIACRDFANRTPLNRRYNHLFALPLLGTGWGGLRNRSDFMVRALLPELRERAAYHGVDIVIVFYEPDAWAAAQRERFRVYEYAQMRKEKRKAAKAAGIRKESSEDTEPEAPSLSSFRKTPLIGAKHLSKELRNEANRLSNIALSGDLALFIGAGVSASAGLPTWGSLLCKLNWLLSYWKDISQSAQSTFVSYRQGISQRMTSKLRERSSISSENSRFWIRPPSFSGGCKAG